VSRMPLLMSFALAASLAAAQVQAAEPKIGVVDMSSLLQKSPQSQNAQTEMAKKFDGRKKDLLAEQDKIKNLQDQVNKNGAVMSASQLQDAQSQLDELQRDFSRKQSDYMDDLNMERNAELNPECDFKISARAIHGPPRQPGQTLDEQVEGVAGCITEMVTERLQRRQGSY